MVVYILTYIVHFQDCLLYNRRHDYYPLIPTPIHLFCSFLSSFNLRSGVFSPTQPYNAYTHKTPKSQLSDFVDHSSIEEPASRPVNSDTNLV